MDMSQYNTGKKTEVDNLKEEILRLKRHNALVDKHWDSLNEIRFLIGAGLYDEAHELFQEIPDKDKIGLNIAPSKGGMFKTYARDIAVNGVDKATGWNWWDGRLPDNPSNKKD